MNCRLGLLVAGSVAEGLSARLDPTVAIEDVRLGKFVKIVGQKYEYFCLVTDVQLDSANPDVLRNPPGDPGTVDVFLTYCSSLESARAYAHQRLCWHGKTGRQAVGAPHACALQP